MGQRYSPAEGLTACNAMPLSKAGPEALLVAGLYTHNPSGPAYSQAAIPSMHLPLARPAAAGSPPQTGPARCGVASWPCSSAAQYVWKDDAQFKLAKSQ